MNRFLGWSAVLAFAFCLTPAVAAVAAIQPVKLRFDPRYILEAVAQRMKVTLRPDVPLPAIFVESTTPLRQFQDVMEGQWQFRPSLITNAYSIASNEIYLSDDASFHARFTRTLDDSLAHELVHYIQAKYLREDLTTEGCEVQAVDIQRWFREKHALADHDIAMQTADSRDLRRELPSGAAAPSCIVTPGADGTRAVRCVAGWRRVPG